MKTPKVNSQIEQFHSIGSVESVKSVSDISTPVSGKIMEFNAELTESHALINEDPYTKGGLQKSNWQTLMKI